MPSTTTTYSKPSPTAPLTLPDLPDSIALYASYQDMAAANGVDPSDPALHPESRPAVPED